jgi:hypothetical protein
MGSKKLEYRGLPSRSRSNVIAMNQVNPYASPTSVPSESGSEPARMQYASRGRAILAGVMRGAFFGGKWGALIGAIVGAFGLIFYKAAASIPVSILYLAVLGALPGALIMGLAGGISYRPASRNNENEQTGQNDAAVSSKG